MDTNKKKFLDLLFGYYSTIKIEFKQKSLGFSIFDEESFWDSVTSVEKLKVIIGPYDDGLNYEKLTLILTTNGWSKRKNILGISNFSLGVVIPKSKDVYGIWDNKIFHKKLDSKEDFNMLEELPTQVRLLFKLFTKILTQEEILIEPLEQ
jgi:hypothetical protein